MTSVALDIPRINDLSPADWDILFGLWNRADGDSLDVAFSFSQCDFLRQNAVAFLGGLARLIELRRGRVQFDWNTLQSDVALNLTKNGFRDAFGDAPQLGVGHSIPYLEATAATDETVVLQYLHSMPLLRMPP